LKIDLNSCFYFQFVAFFAVLALANAGLIAQQPILSYSAHSVQPATYTTYNHHDDHHQILAAPASSSSYTKTLSYSAPKAIVAAAPSIHYEPQHYAAAPQYVSAYHHEPEHHITYAAAAPSYGQHYAHGSSEQNIVRSAHGTVSQISKAVDTPHSSVRKYDTRIINDGYKALSHQPSVAYVQQPSVSYVQQPAQTYIQQQPIVTKTIVSQPQVAHIAQPVHSYAQPIHSYAASAPVLAHKSVQYSPAYAVSHASFEAPSYHYSW